MSSLCTFLSELNSGSTVFISSDLKWKVNIFSNDWGRGGGVGKHSTIIAVGLQELIGEVLEHQSQLEGGLMVGVLLVFLESYAFRRLLAFPLQLHCRSQIFVHHFGRRYIEHLYTAELMWGMRERERDKYTLSVCLKTPPKRGCRVGLMGLLTVLLRFSS